MKCECGEEMLKVIDEQKGISYECPSCGHTIDIFYDSKKENKC